MTTTAELSNTIREKVPHYVEGDLVTGATDVHSENCPGCAIEPALDALVAQAETADRERADAYRAAAKTAEKLVAAEARIRLLEESEAEWQRRGDRAVAAEAERDAAVQAAEAANRRIEILEITDMTATAAQWEMAFKNERQRAEAAERAAEQARDLLRRLRQWDHLDGAHDGPYWKSEIDAALAGNQP